MKIIGIYCIENLNNNKKYIGKSIDCEKRLIQHASDLRRGNHDNVYLQH